MGLFRGFGLGESAFVRADKLGLLKDWLLTFFRLHALHV